MFTGIRKFNGWFLTVVGAAGRFSDAPFVGALVLVMGLFVLTLAYRVSTVLGIRLPWVRSNP